MKVNEFIKKLETYKDFKIETVLHLEVSKEEIQNRFYQYPHDNYNVEINLNDITYYNNSVLIGTKIIKEDFNDENCVKANDLIEKLKEYKNMRIETALWLEIEREDKQIQLYQCAHNYYRAEINIDDIGYGENVVSIGLELIGVL